MHSMERWKRISVCKYPNGNDCAEFIRPRVSGDFVFRRRRRRNCGSGCCKTIPLPVVVILANISITTNGVFVRFCRTRSFHEFRIRTYAFMYTYISVRNTGSVALRNDFTDVEKFASNASIIIIIFFGFRLRSMSSYVAYFHNRPRRRINAV